MKFNQLHCHQSLGLLLLCALVWPSGEALARTAAGIPFEAAQVESSDGKAFVVSWRAAAGVHRVRLFAGTDPAHVGRDHAVGNGGPIGQVSVTDLPPAGRWYFALVPDHGDALVIADRSLHLTTAANFRDVGGYRTSDGRWVRMGLAYRSNGLEHLTDQELAQIEKLDIKLVCDLRTGEEVQRGPDRVPRGAADVSADVLADDADLIHTMITGAAAAAAGASAGAQGAVSVSAAGTQGAVSVSAAGGAPSASAQPAVATAAAGSQDSRHELELRIYRDFVRLPSAQSAYRLLFERLADAGELPTVFHCTAGKDRTGWAQAVFLTILGVPRPTIVRDYELTNEYLQGAALSSVRQSMSAAGQAAATPARLLANPAALEAAFDQVTTQYGSFDRYVTEGLHLSAATLAALRKNFLAD